MKEIMIATSNAHKVEEFREMLEPLGIQVRSLLDLEEKVEIEETGTTFAENAMIKATEIAKIARQMPEYFRGSLYFQRLPALHCTGY